MKRFIGVLLVSVMIVSLAACGAKTQEAPDVGADSKVEETKAGANTGSAGKADSGETGATTDYNGITLTFMNSKPEITGELEEIVKGWASNHNVVVEFYESSDPTGTLTQKYAAGDAPILAILDSTQINEMAEEKMLPLDGEEWVSQTDLGCYVNGKLYGMPLTVESQCLIVNKKAVEKVLGREFDKTKYTTTETLEALFAELREKGMENPMILLSESWSMCSHLFAQMMNFQDGTSKGAFAFVDDIKAGKDCFDNPLFQNQIKIFNLYAEYNINKADPLAAVYDLNCSYLVDGEAAFMSNGTWVWPDLAAMGADVNAFEIMSHPIDNDLTGRVQASATKFIAVDNTNATAEQQAAAKEFLNFLTMTDEGQKALTEKCGIVSAFKNNPYSPADPVNTSLAVDYMSKGKTVNIVPYGPPSDYRKTLESYVQKVVTGAGTARELADAINAYWQTHEPNGR